MKEREIKVLKVSPRKAPEVVTLVNELEELQKAVSIGADYVGLIEIIDIDDDICALCNEEGKLIGLPPNRRIGHDVICGTFYIIGVDSEEGELTSLSDDDIEKYKAIFADTSPVVMTDTERERLCAFRIICRR